MTDRTTRRLLSVALAALSTFAACTDDETDPAATFRQGYVAPAVVRADFDAILPTCLPGEVVGSARLVWTDQSPEEATVSLSFTRERVDPVQFWCLVASLLNLGGEVDTGGDESTGPAPESTGPSTSTG